MQGLILPDTTGSSMYCWWKIHMVVEAVENILRKPISMAIAAIVTLLLILGAIAMIALFFVEEKKHEDDRRGLDLLRDFVIGNNESLKDKGNIYMIQAAYRFMNELTFVQDKNKELKTVTDELKKEKNWYTSGTKRYLFLDTLMTWYTAKNYCAANKSFLALIVGDEVEIFIENMVKEKKKNFWFGLSTNSTGQWFWITGPEPTIQ
ncbi:hypothetical protein lerEdw1_012944 [Lerista edwardsae]|nr:hypothetical protein lerEdw1_012944 [Lerista edwardsae]